MHLQPRLGDAEVELTFVVCDSQRVESIEAAEAPCLSLAISEGLDNGARYRLSVLVEDPTSEDKVWAAPVQVVGFELENDWGCFGVH
jgi:hypothetical protein